jgi:hypothetical protein
MVSCVTASQCVALWRATVDGRDWWIVTAELHSAVRVKCVCGVLCSIPVLVM